MIAAKRAETAFERLSTYTDCAEMRVRDWVTWTALIAYALPVCAYIDVRNWLRARWGR